MAYVSDILTDLPPQYVSDWTALGLIEVWDGKEVNPLPREVVTGTNDFTRKIIDKPTGKPKNTKKK
jgi:hypothetical protein